MSENRNQVHYRVDTLLRYYGIKDEEKLLEYIKSHDQKTANQKTRTK
jgi:hypothetical protein